MGPERGGQRRQRAACGGVAQDALGPLTVEDRGLLGAARPAAWRTLISPCHSTVWCQSERCAFHHSRRNGLCAKLSWKSEPAGDLPSRSWKTSVPSGSRSTSQGWKGQPNVSSERRLGSWTKPACPTRVSSAANRSGSVACSSTCEAITYAAQPSASGSACPSPTTSGFAKLTAKPRSKSSLMYFSTTRPLRGCGSWPPPISITRPSAAGAGGAGAALAHRSGPRGRRRPAWRGRHEQVSGAGPPRRAV